METKMKMPWSVRIALGWFVLLAVGCCALLLSLQGMWFCENFPGAEWMVLQIAGSVGYCALTVGFVAAILCGRRKWVTIPYSVFASAAVVLFTGSGPIRSLVPGTVNFVVIIALMLTALFVALLHMPSANRWFAAFPRRKGLGVGCCSLVALAIAGVTALMIFVTMDGPTRRTDVVSSCPDSVREMEGR